MKRFALIGVGGFVAPRHLAAIRDTGNVLVAALDIHDSAGILDSYFPEADFFTEFERFERHLEKLRREEQGIDYLVVCSPNYLHDAHIRCGMRVGADVICEKPATIKPHNLVAISEMAKKLDRKVYTIMQMRLHPETERIKKEILSVPRPRGWWSHVDIEYVAPRGKWYDYSWKADPEKSGGLIYNLGIHLIDLMCYLFGGASMAPQKVTFYNERTAKGTIFLKHAKADFELAAVGNQPQRMIRFGDKECDFSDGFEDLHTKCYESILKGESLFDIQSALPAIQIADELRNDKP